MTEPGLPALHPVLPLPARPDGGAVVLEHAGARIRSAGLLRATGRALDWLRVHDVSAGDRVALTADKGLPFLACHLACLRLGAIGMPLNPVAAPAEIAHALADADVRVQLGTEEQAQAVGDAASATDRDESAADPCAWDPPDLASPRPTDGAVLLMTSGTTGRPKGVLLSHANLRANTLALHATWGWSRRDVLVHALPLFHAHGLFVALHGALAAGARTVLLDRFDAEEVLACLVARRATLFMGVPTMYHRLVSLPSPTPGQDSDLSALRLLVSGSAPLGASTAAAVQRRFGHRVLVRYGLSEALMVTSERRDGADPRPPGGVGRPLPGVSVRIVAPREESALRPRELPSGEDGEVEVRGPSVFEGYWRDPEATAAVLRDGWLSTGDRGLLEPDGTLRLLGRTRELILSGGFNVYPAEVEGVLEAHPDVTESAVFGLPDADLGERVAAAVVTAPGVELDGLAERLAAHCREHLAAYKCPRRIAALPSLPRNAMGKLQRGALGALPAFSSPG